MLEYFCVVLSCVDTGLTMGQSPVQEVLPKCLEVFIAQRLILSRRRSEDLMRETYSNITATGNHLQGDRYVIISL